MVLDVSCGSEPPNCTHIYIKSWLKWIHWGGISGRVSVAAGSGVSGRSRSCWLYRPVGSKRGGDSDSDRPGLPMQPFLRRRGDIYGSSLPFQRRPAALPPPQPQTRRWPSLSSSCPRPRWTDPRPLRLRPCLNRSSRIPPSVSAAGPGCRLLGARNNCWGGVKNRPESVIIKAREV